MNSFENHIKNKGIVIYGAGVIGQNIVERLIYDNMNTYIKYIAVTQKDGNPDMLYDIPVVAIDEIVEESSECIILIATKKDIQGEIRGKLLELGLKNIYSVNDEVVKDWINNDLYYQRYINPYIHTVKKIFNNSEHPNDEMDKTIDDTMKMLKAQDGVYIPRLVIVLGTKCSLRCKECNNLMPHFKPQKDLDKQKILNSLELFISKVNSILKCELIGGEPFLSANLEDSVQYLLNNNKVHEIEITTNGTIIPKESLTYLLKNTKIMVRISDYGNLVDKNKFVDFLKENSIRYTVLEGGKWISPGGVEKRERSKEQLQEYYSRCSSGYYCKTLYDGKIFSCARSASLHALGYMGEKEYIQIDENLNVDEIKEFWIRDYSEACDYCDVTCDDRKIIEPAEQISIL